MARIRTIKPEILEDDVTAGLSDAGFRLFIAMIVLADDHGNVRSSIEWLRGQVWWSHGESPSSAEIRREIPRVAETLREVSGAGLIDIYEVNGQRYAHIAGWSKHQRIDNAGKGRVPGPNDPAAKAVSLGSKRSRGNSPRVAEVRGVLPLDLRPPTSDPEGDHDHDTASRPAATPPNEFIRIPTNGPVKEFVVTTEMVSEWRQTFPGLDVEFQIRKARQWCIDNPVKRKTASGARKFLGGWLGRQNDTRSSGKPTDAFEMQMERVRMLEEQEQSP